MCRQNTEMIKIICSTAIISVGVLELPKVVEGGNLLEGKLFK